VSTFATELRSWRTRRRVSQLELALRAGTTQRHVSFIEGGRSVPGRGMVVRLAESLDVPLRERNALLLAAGFAPAYAETPYTELESVREALSSVLRGHMPYPAVIVDRHGDLVDANPAFHAIVAEGAPVTNVPRLLLGPLAPRIVNFSEWAWHVVDRLREHALQTPDERLSALVEELTALAGERPRATTLGFAVPLRLRCREHELHLLTTLAHFGTAVDVTVAELRLEAFLPADAETARLLGSLALPG
jgi:transcriptional regulator with XRE-family HTH domain